MKNLIDLARDMIGVPLLLVAVLLQYLSAIVGGTLTIDFGRHFIESANKRLNE